MAYTYTPNLTMALPVSGTKNWASTVATSNWGLLDTAVGTNINPDGSFKANISLTTPTLLVPVIASFASATHNHSNAAGGGSTLNSPTIVTPTIASFVNANHDHSNAAGGGEIADVSIAHNSTGGLNTGDYRHLTAAEYTDLSDAGDSILHYHASDRALSNATGTIDDIANGATYVKSHNDLTDALKTNYDTAYGWGDHTSGGYFVKASDTLDNITDGATYVKSHNDFTDVYKGYLNQGVKTTDSPQFAGLTLTGNLAMGGNQATNLVVHTCTSATRPTAVAGKIIFETDTAKFLYYDGSDWTEVGTGSNVQYYESFTATDAQTLFTLTAGTYVQGASSLHIFVNGQFKELTTEYLETSTSSFTLVDASTAGDIVTAFWTNTSANNLVSMPAGSMIAYGGTVAPAAWLFCDGTAVSRTTYADLFAVIGEYFGVGDGVTTFNLPDVMTGTPLTSGSFNFIIKT